MKQTGTAANLHRCCINTPTHLGWHLDQSVREGCVGSGNPSPLLMDGSVISPLVQAGDDFIIVWKGCYRFWPWQEPGTGVGEMPRCSLNFIYTWFQLICHTFKTSLRPVDRLKDSHNDTETFKGVEFKRYRSVSELFLLIRAGQTRPRCRL